MAKARKWLGKFHHWLKVYSFKRARLVILQGWLSWGLNRVSHELERPCTTADEQGWSINLAAAWSSWSLTRGCLLETTTTFLFGSCLRECEVGKGCRSWKAFNVSGYGCWGNREVMRAVDRIQIALGLSPWDHCLFRLLHQGLRGVGDYRLKLLLSKLFCWSLLGFLALQRLRDMHINYAYGFHGLIGCDWCSHGIVLKCRLLKVVPPCWRACWDCIH